MKKYFVNILVFISIGLLLQISFVLLKPKIVITTVIGSTITAIAVIYFGKRNNQ